MRKFAVQCNQKQQLRDRIHQMQSDLRNMQVSIEGEKLTQTKLKNVREKEEELRQRRDQEEKDILNQAVEEQKESMGWTHD